MEIADKEFMNEHRNIELNILKSYEAIYRKYIDSNYICIIWCGNCKMDMIKTLYTYHENNG